MDKQEREHFLYPLILDDVLPILRGRPCGYTESGREPSLFRLLHHHVNLLQDKRENKWTDPLWSGFTAVATYGPLLWLSVQ